MRVVEFIIMLGSIDLLITIKLMGRLRYINFAVKDTGIGMTSDEQLRLKRFLDKGFKEELELSVNTAGFGFGVFISN